MPYPPPQITHTIAATPVPIFAKLMSSLLETGQGLSPASESNLILQFRMHFRAQLQVLEAALMSGLALLLSVGH